MGRPIQIFLSVFLILTVCSAHAQPINWDSVRAAYVTKYQPQQMPAWLFPIIFEEGTGQRDTIYLGYDEDALPNFGETWFGEIFEPVDTSKFNVSICLDFSFDSIYKVSVSPMQNISQCGDASFSISFHKGLLPLKMYWDREAFYSDSLPFPDQSPAPRAQGELGANMYSYNPDSSYCTGVDFMVLTDTGTGTTGDDYCRRSDSVVFFDFFGTQYVGELYSFKITPWKGYILGTGNIPSIGEISAYPNPTDQFLWIHANSPIQHVCLYDISGREVSRKRINNEEALRWDISHVPNGFYLLQVNTLFHSVTHKIIITHQYP